MKKTIVHTFGLMLALSVAGCGGSSSQESGSAISVSTEEGSPGLTQAAIDEMDFENSFSPYVAVSTDKKYLRLSFGFFPDGTTYNSEKNGEKVYVTFNNEGEPKSDPVEAEKVSCSGYCVMVPCEVITPTVEDLAVGISAPEEGASCTPLKYEFNGDNEAFTVNGYVVAADMAKFSHDFGFTITPDGFKDAVSGEVISGEKLEDVYRKIITTADLD